MRSQGSSGTGVSAVKGFAQIVDQRYFCPPLRQRRGDGGRGCRCEIPPLTLTVYGEEHEQPLIGVFVQVTREITRKMRVPHQSTSTVSR
jgi:hypothetical protein